MTTNFTINDNIITAIDIDGYTVDCSLQIDSDWTPNVESYVLDNGVITAITVFNENNETQMLAYGDCIIGETDEEMDWEIIEPDPETITPTKPNKSWWEWLHDWAWGSN